jgi:hypothetical protein
MDELLEKEIRGGLAFFKEGMGAEGLIRDRYPRDKDLSSIASSGFALASFAIGAHYGFLDHEEARTLSLKIIEGASRLNKEGGFYYHFYDMGSAQQKPFSELSDIDSCLFYMGLLVSANYFGGTLAEEADRLVDEAVWPIWTSASPYLYMGKRNGRFYSYWQDYAEQLMIYVLAAGAQNPDYRLGKAYYDAFSRPIGSYDDLSFIHSAMNGLFVYFFSQNFIDFRGTKDAKGIDWHDNSRKAILADWSFCHYNYQNLQSYKKGWGLSACDGPDGYCGDYGCQPGMNYKSDGTVAIYCAFASLPFAKKEALAAIRYYFSEPSFLSPYGLIDSYNLDRGWRDDGVIGIDKGIELIGISNSLDEFVWSMLKNEKRILEGLAALKIKKED